MSRQSAALVLDVLSDADARVPGFGVETPFDFAFPTAVKTGTSRHFTDNWAVAVTGGFTVAVWVGNFSGQPMAGVSGVTGAGPLLHRMVLLTAQRYPTGTLTRPADVGARVVRICRLSGLRAGPWCPAADEWFMPGTEPAGTCDWHQAGGEVVLPDVYAASAGVPDSGARVVHVGFAITSPRDGDHYAVPPGVDPRFATIALRVTGAGGDEVQWTIDGRAISGSRWQLAAGTHQLRARSGNGKTAVATIVVD
jgi:penicillin-binding protein 1C